VGCFYIAPFLMMFIAGGKYIEDVRKIRLDRAFSKLVKIGLIPSTDATGEMKERIKQEVVIIPENKWQKINGNKYYFSDFT
jgi:hypothetical protein